MNPKMIKALGIIAPIVSAVAAMVNNYISEEKQKEKIDQMVKEAIANQSK